MQGLKLRWNVVAILNCSMSMEDVSERCKVKEDLIEQVAQLAMRLSRAHLADYGAARSRHDFIQRQIMSCLVLRAYLKTLFGVSWKYWRAARRCANKWV